MSMFSFEGLLSIFNSPLITLMLVIVLGLVIYQVIKRGDLKTDMKLFYFADVERMITPLEVNKLTINNVHTRDGKSFWRRAKSWMWKKGTQNFVVWLGKVGRGITYRIEKNPKDENGDPLVEKLGSLYDGVKSCLQITEGELTIESIDEKSIEKLKTSEIFVCVDLEIDPSDIPHDFDEDRAVSESNKNMMDLVGTRIKDKIKNEDWIRNGGLIAVGVAGVLVAQAIGLM